MPDFLNSQWQKFTSRQEVSGAPTITAQQNIRTIHLSNEFVIESCSKLKDKLNGLDIGCNTGYLTANIAKLGHKMVGIDTWSKGLDYARNSYPSLEFLEWDILEAPLEKKFDFIICINVLQCFEEPYLVMRNLAASLVKEKGAKILIITRPANSILTTPLVHKLASIRGTSKESPLLTSFSEDFFKNFGGRHNFSCIIKYRNIIIPTVRKFLSTHMLVELTYE